MKKKLAILLLFSVFISCERDDICAEATPTTPHLIIEFYNVTEPTETKSVDNLRVVGLDNDENELEVYQSATSTASISIPLRTIDNDDDPDNDITTKFSFYKDYEINEDDEISGNQDILSIRYSTEEIFVSRACGYKTIFNYVEVIRETDGDEWIVQILYDNPLTVDNETETHVQIFH